MWKPGELSISIQFRASRNLDYLVEYYDVGTGAEPPGKVILKRGIGER